MAALNVFSCVLILSVFYTSAVDIIGDKHVYLQSKDQNWMTAFETCRYYDKQLLTLLNNKEHEDTVALVAKYKIHIIWLAASDIGHEGNFVWTTNGQTVTDRHWGKGEPNNKNTENCLQLYYNIWNDVSCGREYHFFCEDISN